MPREPGQELVIALAGPAVNVVLAALIWVLLALPGSNPLSGELSSTSALLAGAFLQRLFWVNVVLAAFNMLPAFPMDGGRVLRAILAMRRPYAQATAIAARVGKLFAVLFGTVGMFYLNNPFLVFIALFIWMGAAGEEAAERRTMMSNEGVPVASVMITRFQTLSPDDTLGFAEDVVFHGFQQDFPVVDQSGLLVGVVSRRTLAQALRSGLPERRVSDIMERTFATADPTEPVDTALHRLRSQGAHALPVARDRHLMGMLTG